MSSTTTTTTLTRQKLHTALSQNKHYNTIQPFLQSLKQQNQQTLQIINEVFTEILSSGKKSLLSKLLVIRMFKDIFMMGNMDVFDAIDPGVEEAIISAAAYNPKFRAKGKNDKETRGGMYFIEIQKRQKTAQNLQISNSFVLFSTEIVKYFSNWLPEYLEGQQFRFVEIYDQLQGLGVQFNTQIYFQADQEKKFKKNYLQWKAKVEKEEKQQNNQKNQKSSKKRLSKLHQKQMQKNDKQKDNHQQKQKTHQQKPQQKNTQPIEQLTNQLTQKQCQITHLKTLLQQKTLQLTTTTTTLQTKIKSQHSQLDKLSKSLLQLQTLNTTLKQTIITLQKQKQHLNLNNTNKNQQLTKYNKQYTKQIQKIKVELSCCKEQNRKLNQLKNDAYKKIQNLQNAVNMGKQELDKEKMEVKKYRGMIQKIEKQRQATDCKNTGVVEQQPNSNNGNNLLKLKKLIDKQRKQTQNLKKQHENQKNAIIQNNKNLINQLNIKNKELLDKLGIYEQKISIMERQKKDVIKQMERYKQRQKQKQRQNNGGDKQIQIRNNQKLVQAEIQINKAKQYKLQIQSLTKQRQRYKQQIQQLKKSLQTQTQPQSQAQAQDQKSAQPMFVLQNNNNNNGSKNGTIIEQVQQYKIVRQDNTDDNKIISLNYSDAFLKTNLNTITNQHKQNLQTDTIKPTGPFFNSNQNQCSQKQREQSMSLSKYLGLKSVESYQKQNNGWKNNGLFSSCSGSQKNIGYCTNDGAANGQSYNNGFYKTSFPSSYNNSYNSTATVITGQKRSNHSLHKTQSSKFRQNTNYRAPSQRLFRQSTNLTQHHNNYNHNYTKHQHDAHLLKKSKHPNNIHTSTTTTHHALNKNTKKNIITSVFPLIEEYFAPVDIRESRHFRACCVKDQARRSPFFQDQVIQLHMIKIINCNSYSTNDDTKDKSYQISIKNKQPYPITFKLHLQAQPSSIEASQQIRLKFKDTNKKNNDSSKIHLNAFSQLRIDLCAKITNINFRFPILELAYMNSNLNGNGNGQENRYREEIVYKIPLPITLFSFVNLSQNYRDIQKFDRYHESNYKKHRSQRILMNNYIGGLSTIFSELQFQILKNNQLQCVSILTYPPIPEIKLKFVMVQNQQFCEFQTEFLAESKISEAFSKVILQFLMFFVI